MPLQNAMIVQVIFLEKFARKICGEISLQKELRLGIINFWLVVYGLSQFLARGNSCGKIFGSSWLVVVVVINVLVRCGSW